MFVQSKDLYLLCNNCNEEIYWGDLYYSYCGFCFCAHCLQEVAVSLLHCQTRILGEDMP
ncbi:MAG: hypothetical protein R3Y62_00470 [Eubacteriales bacterium]